MLVAEGHRRQQECHNLGLSLPIPAIPSTAEINIVSPTLADCSNNEVNALSSGARPANPATAAGNCRGIATADAERAIPLPQPRKYRLTPRAASVGALVTEAMEPLTHTHNDTARATDVKPHSHQVG
jgi:hypothetical protein